MRTRPSTALPAALLSCLALAAPAPAADQPVGSPASHVAAQPAQIAPDAPAAGRLESPPTRRSHGLPTALAAVLVGGVASLLVRVLLAEPAARRRTRVPPA